ncbi:MAG TPA: c-type cytochrome [Candidatus Acidoferrales bacterium]|jgi:streptogramin lyase/cytochrome c2|nr:c-type cytochrome [Candidatus Acidoferrales bacterium]
MPAKNRTPRASALLVTLLIALSFSVAGIVSRLDAASAAPKPAKAPKAAPGKDVSTNDDLQRSFRLDTYRILGDSGPARGENIYFYKCWMCHNKYAKTGPDLKTLYQRDTLTSGDEVNDDTVTAKIKEGGPGMPAFRTTLSDSDIADLRAYFHSGKCCADGEDAPANPWYKAETSKWSVPTTLSGGPTGIVKISTGDSPEGIGVQLVAPNGVRTTVYTNSAGKFEFPKMQAGNYTLRIPTPVPFQPYQMESVAINGAIKLDDIVLDRVPTVGDTDNMPATPLLQSELSSAEILWNLPGTAEEKATLQKNCSGCHSWQQIFRNHYDEHSWSLIVDRMMHFAGTAIAVRTHPMNAPDPEYTMMVKFLTRVRGPDWKGDIAYRVFPRPHGENTRVIVTEYELPQQLLQLHDAGPDNQGNIWFTSHKTRIVGKLDPKTGIVKEYMLPLTPDAMPGSHHVIVDKSGIAWISENWAHQLNRLDPATGKVAQWRIDSSTPINAPSFGNFDMSPDGFAWDARAHKLRKIDTETGKIVQEWPLQAESSYDSAISYDGKYWGGSGPANWGNTVEIMNIATGQWINLNTGKHMATAKRGGFDPYNNVWFGGADGSLIEGMFKEQRVEEYVPPIAPHPYTDFYEAMPDKNGDVWAGVLHGRQMLRLNPKTGRWHVYQMPEPFSYDRRTYIDASTHPVTVWYVDYNGYLVRVQPLT